MVFPGNVLVHPDKSISQKTAEQNPHNLFYSSFLLSIIFDVGLIQDSVLSLLDKSKSVYHSCILLTETHILSSHRPSDCLAGDLLLITV